MNRWTIALMSAPLFLWNLSLFADAGAPMTAPPDGGMFQTMVMFGIAAIFFYLILWRPEQKRRKTIEALRSAMKKGDRVTAMGIVGTVSSVKDTTVILRMVDGSKIEVLKGAINEVLPEAAEGEVVVEDDKKSKDKD